MAETEMQKAPQASVEVQASAAEAKAQDTSKLLASFGGFNAIRGFLPDADNLNPARKAAKNVFLTDKRFADKRETLKNDIKGWLALLDDGHGTATEFAASCKEEEEKYLISIRDETRRLSRLVRDMLSASQANARAADPSRRTVFDLTELVLQTLLSFESRATAKTLDVDPQLPDSHILVIADKDAITQVIYNLLDNAVKFARVGSCLTLRLYKDNGKAYVSIKDEGETIPPDDLPFIFDRFHKSDRSRSLDKDGVGLGLYLVKSIINSHDEDIAVRSEEGVTEFVFTLKLAEK